MISRIEVLPNPKFIRSLPARNYFEVKMENILSFEFWRLQINYLRIYYSFLNSQKIKRVQDLQKVGKNSTAKFSNCLLNNLLRFLHFCLRWGEMIYIEIFIQFKPPFTLFLDIFFMYPILQELTSMLKILF